MTYCLICDSELDTSTRISGFDVHDCPRCGRWALEADAFNADLTAKLGDWDQRSIHLRSKLSHIVRRQQRPDIGWVQVSPNLEAMRLQDALPTPADQLERLVIALGESQASPGEHAVFRPEALSALIGATITRNSPHTGLHWLFESSRADTLIDKPVYHVFGARNWGLRLRMPGWSEFETLKRAKIETRLVLMAMKFNDTELNDVVETCFRPAIARAGFELRTIAEKQPAGLIDDQLRVALRTSRFIVVDLTHGNNGAYWEAGFAEGLGRPVIYTCRKLEWEKKATHFDTNHLVTIIWDVSDLVEVGRRLTATVRATLPAEAKMTD